MVKILIDLTEEQDKIVEIYKLVHNLKTKQEAIKMMVTAFEADIQPKSMDKKQYFR